MKNFVFARLLIKFLLSEAGRKVLAITVVERHQTDAACKYEGAESLFILSIF